MHIRSLGLEDPLEEEMVTHSIILAWKIPQTKEPEGYSRWGHKESHTMERLSTRPMWSSFGELIYKITFWDFDWDWDSLNIQVNLGGTDILNESSSHSKSNLLLILLSINMEYLSIYIVL